MKIEPFVREVTRDDPMAWVNLPDGSRRFQARTLESLVKELGGYTGRIGSPGMAHLAAVGGSLEISLEPWRGRDEASTYLLVGFMETYTEDEIRLGLPN